MSTVDVKIYSGVYIPCNGCKYYKECVVPKPKQSRNSRINRTRIVYRCEDYTPPSTTRTTGE